MINVPLVSAAAEVLEKNTFNGNTPNKLSPFTELGITAHEITSCMKRFKIIENINHSVNLIQNSSKLKLTESIKTTYPIEISPECIAEPRGVDVFQKIHF